MKRLALLVMMACDRGEPAVDARTALAEQTIDMLRGFRVEMCWCTNKACTETVGQRIRDSHERWTAMHRPEPKPTEDETRRVQAIVGELVDCQMRVMQSGL